MSDKNMEQSIRRFVSDMGYSTEPDYYGFEGKLPSILNRIFKKHLRMQNEIEQLKAENEKLADEVDVLNEDISNLSVEFEHVLDESDDGIDEVV